MATDSSADSSAVLNFCKQDTMSICDKAEKCSEQEKCYFYEKASHENRCMFLVYDEFCDCYAAQHHSKGRGIPDDFKKTSSMSLPVDKLETTEIDKMYPDDILSYSEEARVYYWKEVDEFYSSYGERYRIEDDERLEYELRNDYIFRKYDSRQIVEIKPMRNRSNGWDSLDEYIDATSALSADVVKDRYATGKISRPNGSAAYYDSELHVYWTGNCEVSRDKTKKHLEEDFFNWREHVPKKHKFKK